MFEAMLLVTVGAQAQSVSGGGEVKPIPAEWAKAFGALRSDPIPEKLTRNSHYWVSDEKRHDLFREAIKDSGGVFIGLGTDQNYLMAGWARPEVLIPFDFDEMIINLHFVFRVFFLECETAEQFIAMWEEERFEQNKALILERYKDRSKKSQKDLVRAYKTARKYVRSRMRRIVKSFGRLDVPTFLSDPEQYRYIRGMFKAGRVFPIRGDLTAMRTMKDVAAATRKSGLTIRTLYLSNAEQYFKYTDQYRQNIIDLPYDDRSIVIRTAGKRTEWAADGLYEYVVQSGENNKTWMLSKRTYNVWTIVQARKVNRKTGGSVVTKLPETKKKK
jgi:hypothetical protein